MDRPLITAKDVESSPAMRIPPGALLTPLARDLLRRRGVRTDASRAVGACAPRLVVANWKSHKTLAEAEAFARELRQRRPGRGEAGCVVCPPFTLLHPLRAALQGAAELGAQDVSAQGEGAHTGEVAVRHLVDAGCRYAIVGHSERRAAGESDALCRRKVMAALLGGLSPILCVGETASERRAGRAEAVVSDQLRAATDGLEPGRLQRVVVAYEPRWAIGSGVTPSAEQVAEMLGHVRAVLGRLGGVDVVRHVSVLYGGSVKESNAAQLLHLPGCSGALIGGASLEARSFGAILAAS